MFSLVGDWGRGLGGRGQRLGRSEGRGGGEEALVRDYM